jgi:gas vesicle protein
MSDDNNGIKMLTAFVIGTALGAIMGILFAPNSGKETRHKIMDLSKKMEDDIKDGFDEITETAKTFMVNSKDESVKKTTES